MSDNRRLILMLVAATIIAGCLAVIRLDYEPLWLDEAVTFFRTRLPIAALVEDSEQNGHNPFYFLIMKAWLKFEDSEFWMRFFSALCFAFTMPVVYVIGRTVGGRRAGCYAVGLAATAPFLIRYAQDARMYAMLTFFCSLALMSAALIISRQSDRPPPVIGASLRHLWRGWRGKAVRLSGIRTFVRGGGGG